MSDPVNNRMNSRRVALRIVLAELMESLLMALGAIRGHKLRSSLTLLGVLVGVFSIIGVMTALRVLQSDIEGKLSQLGANSFMVTKFPNMMFTGRSNWREYRRRKDITLDMATKLIERADLPAAVGAETTFWGGQVESRFASTAPNVQLYGETPGSFPVRNWVVEEGRGINDADVENSRDVAVLGFSLARTVFPFGDAIGQSVKLNGINYTVIGVLESKGGTAENDQENQKSDDCSKDPVESKHDFLFQVLHRHERVIAERLSSATAAGNARSAATITDKLSEPSDCPAWRRFAAAP